jgi:hypothetical protein
MHLRSCQAHGRDDSQWRDGLQPVHGANAPRFHARWTFAWRRVDRDLTRKARGFSIFASVLLQPRTPPRTHAV